MSILFYKVFCSKSTWIRCNICSDSTWSKSLLFTDYSNPGWTNKNHCANESLKVTFSVTSMLVTDIEEMCWWLWDVGGSFGHFGRQHPNFCHQYPKIVTSRKSSTSLLPTFSSSQVVKIPWDFDLEILTVRICHVGYQRTNCQPVRVRVLTSVQIRPVICNDLLLIPTRQMFNTPVCPFVIAYTDFTVNFC